jgi:hypothetical protein
VNGSVSSALKGIYNCNIGGREGDKVMFVNTVVVKGLVLGHKEPIFLLRYHEFQAEMCRSETYLRPR